jgi:hypothetical protein
MTKLSESAIEDFALDLLQQQGYSCSHITKFFLHLLPLLPLHQF